MIIAVVAVLFTLVAFIINLRKWRVAYLVIGSFLLITIVLAIGSEGKIYRNSLKLNNHYKASCRDSLINIPEASLVENGCPRKYLSVKSFPYLTCPKHEQATYWEQGESSQIGPVVCLNMQCCSVVSRTYQIWLMRLALANLSKNLHIYIKYFLINADYFFRLHRCHICAHFLLLLPLEQILWGENFKPYR